MTPFIPGSKEMDTAEAIFKQHPFATLVLPHQHEPLPLISHLPFLHDRQNNTFYCHVAANNPVVGQIQTMAKAAKLVFGAEHGYVSPTWSEDIRVPTWDYCVVHVEGVLSIVEDEMLAKQSMAQQIAAFEPEWSMAQVKDKMLPQLLKAIKVLRLSEPKYFGRYKMSQNKSADAKTAISAAFSEKGQAALVERYQTLWRS